MGRKDNSKTIGFIAGGLLLAALVLSMFNLYQLQMKIPTTTQYVAAERTTENSFAPAGTPEYGKDLGVSFDDVSALDPAKADRTIRILSQFDKEITLSDAEKARYVNILYELGGGMSCEYCCGARSIIFASGEPACGCAHSYAMRGVAKLLITEYGDKYTDEEILAEVGKWKMRFFPAQMENKAKIMEENGIEVDYVALTSNMYRGIEKGASGSGMVGGC